MNVAVPLVQDFDSMSLAAGKSKDKVTAKAKDGKEVKFINCDSKGRIYTPASKLIELHEVLLKDGRIAALEDPEKAEPAKEADAGKEK